MPYTTYTKVVPLLPSGKQLDDSTEPTIAVVNAWLVNLDGRINSAMAQGGRTYPATDAQELAALDLLEAQRAAWMVMAVDGAVTNEHPYYAEFEAALEALARGAAVSVSDTRPLVWSYLMGARTNGDASMAPAFTRDKRY